MLLEQKVTTKITSKNVKHYEKIGFVPTYHIDKKGIKRLKQTVIEVDVKDLPKSSHIPVKIACDICGKIYTKIYKETVRCKNNICSDECYSVLRQQKAIKVLEQKIGMSFEEYLRRKYLKDMKTARQIAKEVYGKATYASTILYWLKKFDIPLRHGSEAIKTQWINAEQRRKKASENANKTILRKEVRDKMRLIQQTKEYKIKSSKSKMGEKNPMYNVKGAEHPNWNPKLTDEDRIRERKTNEDVRWRSAVYLKDKYKCQKCGSNSKLNAHHILNYKSFKELRYDINNGITLCEGCHIDFHKTYGYTNNTAKQLNEFLKEASQ